MGRKGAWPHRVMLIELYEKEGNADRVAKLMRMHPHTIRKYLKYYGYSLKAGPQTGRRRWSEFAQWLKDNPDEILPPSIKEIHELTGVPKNSIKSYLYRRRKEAKQFLSTQPWRNGRCVLWENSLGVKIPDTAFSYVRSFVGFSGALKFIVRLQDRTPYIFYITLKDLKRMYQ